MVLKSLLYSHLETCRQERNYAANKTKQVAWFVSNCGARNGRLNYARELGKYIGRLATIINCTVTNLRL